MNSAAGLQTTMKIGYARVSTEDQNLSLQRDALLAAGCERIFEDKESGAKADRPGLAAARDFARPGDVLTVWRLDRLGRSMNDLVRVVGELESTGIEFESITEKIASIHSLSADPKQSPGAICKALGISRATFYKYAAKPGA